MYPKKEFFFDINSVIKDKNIVTFFQPIVSVVKKSLIGLEGLSRGTYGIPGTMITPTELFKQASENGLTVELDRLCREKALHSFHDITKQNNDFLLFINMDTSILDTVVGSKHLLHETRKWNLEPNNIVIEINETKANNSKCLKDFIDSYREFGFLIALDDVGSGFSNLDRIPLTRPDIIKIDRGIVHGIDQQYYKQEVFKSLIGLSKNIGALVVAEGIETVDEALLCLELGADLLQGYYFSRPVEASIPRFYHCQENINTIASQFKSYMNKKNRCESEKLVKYDMILQDVCLQLSTVTIFEFGRRLQEIIGKHRFVECTYILDKSGTQISETVCRPYLKSHRSPIFQPAQKGENHSLKSYYYSLVHMGLSRYVTSPYISMATGNLCITISAVFRDFNDNPLIFCMDFDPNSFEYFDDK